MPALEDAPPQMEMAAEEVAAAAEEVAAEALAARHYDYYFGKSPSTCRVLPELRGSQHSAFFRHSDACLHVY
jgi:hypothetical protein